MQTHLLVDFTHAHLRMDFTPPPQKTDQRQALTKQQQQQRLNPKGVTTYTYFNTWEDEDGETQVQGQPGFRVRLCLRTQNKAKLNKNTLLKTTGRDEKKK